jgi:hypothetical protein
MKKNYIKPEMRVVKLQYRNRLLVGSGGEQPSGWNGQKLGTYRDSADRIESEDDIF